MNHSWWDLAVLWLQHCIMTHYRLRPDHNWTSLFWSFSLSFRAVMGLGHGSYCFALLRSIPAVFYVVLVTGLRYHLFIWSVFSPKLLYEAMHTLINTAICLFFTFMDQERSARPWIQRQNQSQTQVQNKRCSWVLCTKRRNKRKSDGRRFSVILLLWMRSTLRIQSLHGDLACSTDFYSFVCVMKLFLYFLRGLR